MTASNSSPYLSGLPHLPDDLLQAVNRRGGPMAPERRPLSRAIKALAQQIRARRDAHVASHGPIVVEPPYGLDPSLAERPAVSTGD